MLERQTAWEWTSRDAMQSYLAGDADRDAYLSDRRELAATVRRTLALSPADRVFEIGSGEGVMARDLAPDVAELACLDVSEAFLRVARDTCADRPNVTFHKIDGDVLDCLPDARFDRGYCFNVFIHLDGYEIYHYLAGAARVLRPGGRFLFNFATLGPATLPLFRTYADRYRSASPMELPGFMQWHDREVIEGLAAEAGLIFEDPSFTDGGGICSAVVRSPDALGGGSR